MYNSTKEGSVCIQTIRTVGRNESNFSSNFCCRFSHFPDYIPTKEIQFSMLFGFFIVFFLFIFYSFFSIVLLKFMYWIWSTICFCKNVFDWLWNNFCEEAYKWNWWNVIKFVYVLFVYNIFCIRKRLHWLIFKVFI